MEVLGSSTWIFENLYAVSLLIAIVVLESAGSLQPFTVTVFVTCKHILLARSLLVFS